MATNVIAGERATRRVMIRVPVHVGTFLDLVCKYSGTRKGTMVNRVWAAGIREVFGITVEQLEECALTVPRDHRTQPHASLKELTRLLCGEE